MSDITKQPTWQVPPKLRSRARTLRRNLTDAERIVWNALRAHRLNGASFRRQAPMGPYVVDFVCHAAHLVVEIDGGQHFEAEQMTRDAKRDAYLSSRGYRVLRFNNHDLMTNRVGVFESIATALTASPSPSLPRKRGREQTVCAESSES